MLWINCSQVLSGAPHFWILLPRQAYLTSSLPWLSFFWYTESLNGFCKTSAPDLTSSSSTSSYSKKAATMSSSFSSDSRKRFIDQGPAHLSSKRPRTFWDTVLTDSSHLPDHIVINETENKHAAKDDLVCTKVSNELLAGQSADLFCTSPLTDFARSSSPPEYTTGTNSFSLLQRVVHTSGEGLASATEAKVSSKPHSCELCQATFARSSHLRLHVRTIHEKLKPFRCGECSATFGHISSKYRHFRTVHLKRRDFSCSKCGQTFAERSAVQKHCRTVHEGSRPYPCPTCGFRFHFKLHLTQHIATVHEKLRPHVCRTCHARFGQRSSLNRHARQIHGEIISRSAQRQMTPTPTQVLNDDQQQSSFNQKVPENMLQQTGMSNVPLCSSSLYLGPNWNSRLLNSDRPVIQHLARSLSFFIHTWLLYNR